MLCSPDNNSEIVDLEDLCVDHLWQCIAYASKHKPLYREGFCTWITPHLETDKDLAVMIHNYCVSTMTHQYKYGIKLPWSAKHALELDKKNGNNLWAEAIKLEIHQMINKFKAFWIHDSKTPPVGFQKLRYHFVFDIKVDRSHKAWWVMDSNFSPEMPREDCFASVVSTKAVRLGFILAQVQNLK